MFIPSCVETGFGGPTLPIKPPGTFFQIPPKSVLSHPISQHFGKPGINNTGRITCTLLNVAWGV